MTRPTRRAAALALLLAAAGASRAAEISCSALAPARRAAVLNGTEYLKRFFEREERRAALSTDAVSIFLELGETAADEEIRASALAEARRLAAPLARAYAAPGGIEAHENLLGALSLLPDSGVLHLSRKSLLRAVSHRLAGPDPGTAYYGSAIDPARLDALDGDALYAVLISSYTVERARLAFPALPAARPDLGGVLRFVRSRPLAPLAAGDPGSDDFYLATHVAYVLSDYSRFRLEPGDLGKILPYLRDQAPHALATSDAEAAAEIVDVLRQLGRTDADPDVCRLSHLLLAAQRPDGSWAAPDAEDAYDEVHPAWVAVQALRDRIFRPEGAWTRRVRVLLAAPAPPRVP